MMIKMRIFAASLFLSGMILAGCNSQPKADAADKTEKLEAARGLHEADKHGHSLEDGGHEHN